MIVHEYRDILLNEFYLADDDLTIHRKQDGYFNRFKKDDIVTYYQDKQGYDVIDVPKGIRRGVFITHLLCLLRGIHLPKHFVMDHLNGDVTDNRRSNLRVTDIRTNNCNRRMRSDNTSGITGIYWSEYHQHYVIRRTIKGKRLSRSRKTLDKAKLVLEELCRMDDTYTERHGK